MTKKRFLTECLTSFGATMKEPLTGKHHRMGRSSVFVESTIYMINFLNVGENGYHMVLKIDIFITGLVIK